MDTEENNNRSTPGMANRWGSNGNNDRTLFSWAPRSLWTVDYSQEIKRSLLLERKAMTNLTAY